jgi:hypothetical protein
MGVQFWCPKAPPTLVERPCTSPGCIEGYYCGLCRNGFEEVEEGVMANMSLAGARDILGLLDLPFEQVGHIPASDLKAHIESLQFYLEFKGPRAHLLRPSSVEVGGQGARVLHMGTTDEMTIHRIERLLDVLTFAHGNGLDVAWG